MKTETTQKTVRSSRKGVALGNRFSALPFVEEDGSPALKRTQVLTLDEVSMLVGRTKPTVKAHLQKSEINAVVLVRPTGRGRPSPAYSRQEVESSFGILDPREEADDLMGQIANLSDNKVKAD